MLSLSFPWSTKFSYKTIGLHSLLQFPRQPSLSLLVIFLVFPGGPIGKSGSPFLFLIAFDPSIILMPLNNFSIS